MKKLFIQANRKQILGAWLARYAFERATGRRDGIAVEILDVDAMPEFRAFAGRTYLRDGRTVTYDPADLQSFTLSRFMPPERMGFQGRAVVIDPDIFAMDDVAELFDMDLGGKAVAACRKKDAWDTSVMALDCARLGRWRIAELLAALGEKRLDYSDLMTLRTERGSVKELPRLWNSLDALDESTRFLHTTGRLTQPWKTGLPIDFTRNPLPKLFGLVPREPIHRLLGKYPSRYQPHPDKRIEAAFFGLLRDAVRDGAVTEAQIRGEVEARHVRPDLLERAAA
jgi:hypothetical protein